MAIWDKFFKKKKTKETILTIEWFNTLLPDKIENKEEETKFLEFLQAFKNHCNKEDIYAFLVSNSYPDRISLCKTISNLVDEYAQYINSNLVSLREFTVPNEKALSDKTIHQIADFVSEKAAISINTITACQALIEMLIIKDI